MESTEIMMAIDEFIRASGGNPIKLRHEVMHEVEETIARLFRIPALENVNSLLGQVLACAKACGSDLRGGWSAEADTKMQNLRRVINRSIEWHSDVPTDVSLFEDQEEEQGGIFGSPIFGSPIFGIPINRIPARIPDPGTDKRVEFEKELAALINRYSFETESNTPDFVLAEYLTRCLLVFGIAIGARDRHRSVPFETKKPHEHSSCQENASGHTGHGEFFYCSEHERTCERGRTLNGGPYYPSNPIAFVQDATGNLFLKHPSFHKLPWLRRIDMAIQDHVRACHGHRYGSFEAAQRVSRALVDFKEHFTGKGWSEIQSAIEAYLGESGVKRSTENLDQETYHHLQLLLRELHRIESNARYVRLFEMINEHVEACGGNTKFQMGTPVALESENLHTLLKAAELAHYEGTFSEAQFDAIMRGIVKYRDACDGTASCNVTWGRFQELRDKLLTLLAPPITTQESP